MKQLTVLFNYKGKEILIKKINKKYQVGIRKPHGLDIWLEKGVYNSVGIARTSGRDYARIVIDKMIVSRKEEARKNP